MKFPCIIVEVSREGVATSEIFQTRDEFCEKYKYEVAGYWFGDMPCNESQDGQWIHALEWRRSRVEVIDNATTAAWWADGRMDDIRRYQYADLIKPEVIRAIPELFPDVADMILTTTKEN